MYKFFASAVCLLGLFGLDPAKAQEQLPLGEMLVAQKQLLRKECQAENELLSSLATAAGERKERSLRLLLKCDCLPAEIDRAISTNDPNTTQLVGRDKFLSAIKNMTETCFAKLVRQQFSVSEFKRECESEEKAGSVSDRVAYCRCLADGISALNDKSIATLALESYKNYETKIKGERDGKYTATLESNIKASCSNYLPQSPQVTPTFSAKLLLAIREHNVDAVKAYVSAGGDVNALSCAGLFNAYSLKQLEIAKYLESVGAAINKEELLKHLKLMRLVWQQKAMAYEKMAELFQMDYKRWPNDRELQAFSAKYMNAKARSDDEWGNPIVVKVSSKTVVVGSYGADGKIGGHGFSADIFSNSTDEDLLHAVENVDPNNVCNF